MTSRLGKRGVRVKPIWVSIHKWTGLVLLALLLTQSLSGIALVHKESLRRLENHELSKVQNSPIADLDAIIESIKLQFPDGQLERLTFDKTNPTILIARVYSRDGELTVQHINGSNTETLKTGTMWAYPSEVAERLHVSLLAGDVGHIILIIEGVGLIILAISGVYLWLPRSGWKKAFVVRWKTPSQMLLRDIHAVPGAFLAVFFLISGATGTMMIAEGVTRSLVSAIAPVGPEISLDIASISKPEQMQSYQLAYRRLKANYPDGEFRQLRFFGNGRVVGAVIAERDLANPRAHSFAGIDRWTGEFALKADASDRPDGDVFIEWLLPLHNGEAYGRFRGVLMTLVGLGLASVSGLGLARWVARQFNKRKRLYVK